MSVHQIALYASDLTRARTFYETYFDASFVAEFNPPGLLFLSVGSTRLLLENNAPQSLIYHLVADVDREVERQSSRGVEIHTEAHTIYRDVDGTFGVAGVEERMAFIRDSEGNLVGLVSRRPIEDVSPT